MEITYTYGKDSYEVHFDIHAIPTFCGGKLITSVLCRNHKTVPDKLLRDITDTLLAKAEKDLPCCITRHNGTGSLIHYFEYAKFIMTDRVREDNTRLSCYSLGMGDDRWYTGPVSYNPNSGNAVQVFELDKGYTEEETQL